MSLPVIETPSGFVPFPAGDVERPIPERFGRIARLHAERVAVSAAGQAITYAELARAASGVARFVPEAGGPGDVPVALFFEAGAEAVAAMLGALEAGRFYVPLDPAHPPARNRTILDECGARLLITDAAHHRQAEELGGPFRVVSTEAISPAAPGNAGHVSGAPGERAYVIYTSGATGCPKGVVHSHRNVLFKAMEHVNTARISADDRVALLYSPAASGSVRDIYAALLSGATLCPFDVARRGFAELGRWLEREEITVYNSVATVFRHLAATLDGTHRFPKLRVVHVGSETIHRRDVELHRRLFSGRSVFVANLGSTETSPIRRWVADPDTELPDGTVPAGYPVDGVDVLLLDEEGREVAGGEPGEIAIRSPYLFLGYWRRPELDARAFRPDPRGAGDRVFRTGDLGILRSDGCLVHLGRKDQQVKIRGHRIEPAEVELAVLEGEEVAEAAVVARTRGNGDAELVAYVVPAPGIVPDVARLRGRVGRKLPPAMVPSSFVLLPALPVNATGKVDRRALRGAPETPRTAYVPPSGATETELARIWEEVLETAPVGIHDGFLDLGGHSLLALRLVARILEAFGVEVPPRLVFEQPTVAALARHLDTMRWAAGGRRPVADLAGDREEGVL